MSHRASGSTRNTLESFLDSTRRYEVPSGNSSLFAPTERNCALAMAVGVERDVAAFIKFFALLRSSHHEFSGFTFRNADWWNQQRQDAEENEEDFSPLAPREDANRLPPPTAVLHSVGHAPRGFHDFLNRCFCCLHMTSQALVDAGALLLQLAPKLQSTVVGAMMVDTKGLGESHFSLCTCCSQQHYHVPHPNLVSPVAILAGFLGNAPLVARLHEERQVLFVRSSAIWGILEGCHVDVLFYFIRRVFCQYVSSPGGNEVGSRRPDSPTPGVEWQKLQNSTFVGPPKSFRDEFSFHCIREAICAVPLVDRRRTIESVVLESGRPEMIRAIQMYRTEQPPRPKAQGSGSSSRGLPPRNRTSSGSDDNADEDDSFY